jgi:hypothetical protein
MSWNVIPIFNKKTRSSKEDTLWWGIFSLSKGMAKRIQFLLQLADSQSSRPKEQHSGEKNIGKYAPIVRGRTIRRTMKALWHRAEKLEIKIQELRSDEERFRLTIRIFLMLVALKIQNKNDISNISEDEVNAIIHTPSKDDHEMDAIIEILLHFGFTREEISETLQWNTAKRIRPIGFSDIYSFLKNLPKTPQ